VKFHFAAEGRTNPGRYDEYQYRDAGTVEAATADEARAKVTQMETKRGNTVREVQISPADR
jgi:hypothetical protein